MSEPTSTQEQPLTALWSSHRRWLAKLLQLGALESKIWLTSSAQLLALMCGMLMLLTSAWLLTLAMVAVLLWQAGLPLVAVMALMVLLLLLSTAVIYGVIRRILQRMDISRSIELLLNPQED